MEDKRPLTFSQVDKLNNVLSTEMEILSHNNFPSLTITPASWVRVVKQNLLKAGIRLKDIRMNGSAASYCICEDSDNHPQIHYNDIDLIFGVSIKDDGDFHVIKQAVMESLLDFLPEMVCKSNITSQLMEETYVRKMVLVSNQTSRWSLISLGDSRSTSGMAATIELKFVDKMRRKYEFTVDSFQILMDSYFDFNQCTEESPVSMSQMFFPSIYALSVYDDYDEAIDHLNNRLIHTKAPEEIRGGGLLKYCSLLVNGFRPADLTEMRRLEPYMCSRFFIDFPTEEVQYAKIEKYVASRFMQHKGFGEGMQKGVEFLDILYAVVVSRAKCLVESERLKTMRVIAYIKNLLSPPSLPSFYPYHIVTGFHHHQHQNHHRHYQHHQHHQQYNSTSSAAATTRYVHRQHDASSFSRSSSPTSTYKHSASSQPLPQTRWNPVGTSTRITSAVH